MVFDQGKRIKIDRNVTEKAILGGRGFLFGFILVYILATFSNIFEVYKEREWNVRIPIFYGEEKSSEAKCGQIQFPFSQICH